jgi:microsomal dipeptidase-like Zn-dependent dipeptidase
VWGFADVHVHQFSNLGFGGLVVWGQSFTPDDSIETALPWDDWTPGHAGDVVDKDGNAVGLQGCPALIPPFPSKCVRHSEVLGADCAAGTGVDVFHPCNGFFVHGPGGLGDLVNSFATGTVGHNVGGYPEFDGWPRFNNVTSQQVYYEWLKRAYDGGLRLMVMLAVNNEVLCKAGAHIAAYGCDDMPAVDRQIQAAKDLQTFVDTKAGGAGQGWYRIVTTPAQARAAAANNQLAVVLGIEVDSLFGCTKHATTNCSAAHIEERVQHYYDQGVRHVFPVHLTDNGFGGTALYDDMFAFNTKLVSNDWWDYAPTCPTGVDFHLGTIDTLNDIHGIPIIGDWFNQLISAFTGVVGGAIPPKAPAGPNCNVRTLTGAGSTLVNSLIDHHMIMDVDHMDAPTFDAAMDIAEGRKYPGISSGHTGIVPTANPGANGAHEGNKTLAQLNRIRDDGGLVSIILHQGDRAKIKEYKRGTTAPIPFDCGNSDQSWAQVYLYAVDHMNGGAVGIGSDFNGLAGEPAPRFNGHGHNDACQGDFPGGYSPAGGVSYPITPFGLSGSLGKLTAGSRTFDYNDDGLANIGLYPDFIQDLRSQGLSNADLNPLFNSAEAYIEMWEKSEDETAPDVSCDTPDTDWHAANVSLNCTASDYPSGLESAADSSFVLSTTVAAGSETSTAATGSRNVCDKRGNCVVIGPFTPVKVDRKAPVVTCTPPDTDWHASDVVVPCSATEGGSGLSNADDALFSLSTSVALGTETASASTPTRTVCDGVGNCSVGGPYTAKVDKKAPVITITQPAATNYLHNSTLTLVYGVTDGGSGVATVVPTLDGASSVAGHGLLTGQAIDLLTEVPSGSHTFLVQAADSVGNMSSLPVVFGVIVTPAVLADEVTHFRANGQINKQGTANSLQTKLAQAAAARAAGNCALAASTYQAFINEVEAQTGKAIDTQAAAILIADAQYLATHCP